MRSEVVGEFLVFARYMNFSKAAAELHMAQPNLSKHMMELEREIGVSLIDRTTYGKNKPVLTIAGQYFFEEMSNLQNEFLHTVQYCREIGTIKAHEVTIQELWPNKAMTNLYLYASEFHRQHVDTIAHYSRMTGDDPITALLEGSFDLVFDIHFGTYENRIEELESQGVHAIRFLDDQPLVWFQNENRRLAGKSEVSLDDLLDVPVLEVKGKNYDYVAMAYIHYCERENVRPRLRQLQLMDNSPTDTFMADFRNGALITTSSMLHDPRLSMRADISHALVSDPCLILTFSLAVRADDEPSVRFLDFIEDRIAH